MRFSLTKKEIEIIIFYADCNMRTSTAATLLGCHKSTVTRAFSKIFKRTGYDPSDFWDLHTIISELEKEGYGER